MLFNCSTNNAACQNRVVVPAAAGTPVGSPTCAPAVICDYWRYRTYETIVPLRNAIYAATHPMKTPPPSGAFRSRQRGIALFVALIGMVLLSLAGIALVRSVDTTSAVASNIAFRQASVGPISRPSRTPIYNLFKAPAASRIGQTGHNPARGYYALLQPGEYAQWRAGRPRRRLRNDVGEICRGAGLPAAVVDINTKMEVRSVIERVCTNAAVGPTWPVSIGTCDTLPPKVSPAGTDNKYKPIPLPPIPNFRVTVRVDLPNSNTVSHAQAFLR